MPKNHIFYAETTFPLETGYFFTISVRHRLHDTLQYMTGGDLITSILRADMVSKVNLTRLMEGRKKRRNFKKTQEGDESG